MIRSRLYNLLEYPLLYNFVQFLFAPGGIIAVTNLVRKTLNRMPRGQRILDVGCGPASWLFRAEVYPIGLDISPSYMQEFATSGRYGVVGSADNLPFTSQSFDAVWSIGLFHHLPDEVALATLNQLVRVCKKGGCIVIMDAVLPRRPRQRPIAALTRRMDRGKFMRSEAQWLKLLTPDESWEIQRRTYTLTGLEMLICTTIKQN